MLKKYISIILTLILSVLLAAGCADKKTGSEASGKIESKSSKTTDKDIQKDEEDVVSDEEAAEEK